MNPWRVAGKGAGQWQAGEYKGREAGKQASCVSSTAIAPNGKGLVFLIQIMSPMQAHLPRAGLMEPPSACSINMHMSRIFNCVFAPFSCASVTTEQGVCGPGVFQMLRVCPATHAARPLVLWMRSPERERRRKN